jgi:hypothetical protein
VPGEDGVDDLGLDGVFIAGDAGEEGLAFAEALDEVVAELVFDRARGIAGVSERAEGNGGGRGRGVSVDSHAGL